ncbi:MAG: arginine N-succinyltransferase [Sphingomonadaceae bacterium]
MTFRMRTARPSDLPALYEMAKLTGGGFTNLPPDRKNLTAKLEASAAALARADDTVADDRVALMLENVDDGHVRGTCQIFSKIGETAPFYSYRLGTLTQTSKELNRTFRAELLTLSTDFEGASEVGGLFLHPNERAGGLGLLIARSRYLYIGQHRARFADRLFAELRGVIDEGGGSPFWDGLAGKFFGMTFQEADAFNAINGHQMIADLMPKHPVYTALLPDSARLVMGVPHSSGRAAMRMLENEGFVQDFYIDIFDGGPTMHTRTDRVKSIAGSQTVRIERIAANDAIRTIVATGRLADFVAAYASVTEDGTIDPDGARLLGVERGCDVVIAPR